MPHLEYARNDGIDTLFFRDGMLHDNKGMPTFLLAQVITGRPGCFVLTSNTT